MKFEDIINEKIVIEFNENSEINEFKKWCINNNIRQLQKLDRYLRCYRIDSNRDLQGDTSTLWYENADYQIVNFKEFQETKVTIKELGITNINCETEEEAVELLQLLHNEGFKWSSKATLLRPENKWDDNKNKTLYKIYYEENIVRYGHINEENSVTTFKELKSKLNNTILLLKK